MERRVIFDIETTGLEFKQGDRIIEFAALEMIDRKLTGNKLHLYINPEGKEVGESIKIHNLTDEFLADKPKFKEVLPQIIDFLSGSIAMAHNGKTFDELFINHEMTLCGSNKNFWDIVSGTEDTLITAKQIDPSKRGNKLDDLADRYGVNRNERIEKGHGALIDCELLYEVYIKMTDGIDFDVIKNLERYIEREPVKFLKRKDFSLPKIKLSPEDIKNNELYLNNLESSGVTPLERKKNKGMKI